MLSAIYFWNVFFRNVLVHYKKMQYLVVHNNRKY